MKKWVFIFLTCRFLVVGVKEVRDESVVMDSVN